MILQLNLEKKLKLLKKHNKVKISVLKQKSKQFFNSTLNVTQKCAFKIGKLKKKCIYIVQNL